MWWSVISGMERRLKVTSMLGSTLQRPPSRLSSSSVATTGSPFPHPPNSSTAATASLPAAWATACIPSEWTETTSLPSTMLLQRHAPLLSLSRGLFLWRP
eukprot:Lithocolla_globosa_v1_NODE_5145_length_1295_cov_18.791935.p2 type:complete len:100 gc:universal NODE_5145_length_1295_cov_18.791935:594-893(+)